MPTLRLALSSSRTELADGLTNIKNFLAGHLAATSHSQLLLAIEELLQNAYEHGSLGITGAEKANLLDTGQFDAELAKREKSHAALPITVDVSIDESSVTCIIEDNGGGFDPDLITPPPLDALHGRGLTLARKLFDTLTFDHNGARVTAVKRL